MAERRRDRVAGKDVERIGHGERRAILGRGNRQRTRPAQEFGPQPIEKQRRVGIVRDRHERNPDQLCQYLGKPALADQAELGQHVVEPAAGFTGDAARAVERALVDRAAGEEGRAKPCHGAGGVLGGW